MIMKAYKFRIYPTYEQIILINKTIGCSRYIFNYFLNQWNTTFRETGKGLSYKICSDQLPHLKLEHEWLKEVDSIALQSSTRNLSDAFDRFFKGQNELPRFKSKKNKVQSYITRFTNHNIKIEKQGLLKLPKLGFIRFAQSRQVEGRIINATVRRNPSGKYFVSIMSEVEVEKLSNSTPMRNIGIDVGLKTFATCSNEMVYENPKFFRKKEQKLAQLQRILSRRKVGSNRWNKQRVKVARMHESITNARMDFLHKVSTDIVKKHDIIGIEHLKISNLIKNKKLSKAISEVSWSEFFRMLKYKSLWYGRTTMEVASDYPSSQLCSNCNYQNRDVKNLNLRMWTCPNCNANHDRDVNASKNIQKESLRLYNERIQTTGTVGLAQ
ncbi:IS200/IS605 family element RNA-guided endonuclease TnpB [Paenibacillus sp. DMB5]|uniref:IS200/IS605 family element RNA-guided endonuclease TnpB n=1 Tax=Paenibacillus sp. DMB5 TaxID=1780103 RepID=UPI0018E38794|nr:IS200/IS605 family element RNA-guided endonuclease TnpB [Paenibacillus sp. DMB5]